MARILVIEDSPTQARQLAYILEDAGFLVETAPDAEAGLEMLAEGLRESRKTPFDLVLSDLLLPGDSGSSRIPRKMAGMAMITIDESIMTRTTPTVVLVRATHL